MTANVWLERRRRHLQQLAGMAGKSPADPVINSMGSTGPPFIEPPQRVCDWLRCDGAQVTRPSIDPYREIIDTSVFLAQGRLRLAMPIFFGHLPPEMPSDLFLVFAQVAHRMSILLDVQGDPPASIANYRDRLLVKADVPKEDGHALEVAGFTLATSNTSPSHVMEELGMLRGASAGSPVFVRLPADEAALTTVCTWSESGADGIILDEDASAERPVPLELAVAETDRRLKGEFNGREPLRWRVDLLAEARYVRGADDVVKLMCLGADAVGLSDAALIGLGWDGDPTRWPRVADANDKLENLLLGLQREVKLLVGAAGVSAVFTSLPGSRELLRAVDLDPALRRRLQVKSAGVG